VDITATRGVSTIVTAHNKMKKVKTILSILIVSMGLFSFLKKEKKEESNSNSIILGMILLEEANSMKIEGLVNDLRSKWRLVAKDVESDKDASTMIINGYKIAIANMPVSIPGDEVESAAAYNYFWQNGIEEAPKHKGHVILSIMNAGKNAVQENLLFTKVASAILENSESSGIYIGERSLVLKKDFYLANAEMMSEQSLPLYNWIYFGLREENDKRSIYTYGLTSFGKKEMEILDSSRPFEELNEMMFNMAHYVIAYDVILQDGETIGISADQKLNIKETTGKFVEGKSLKIIY
jgi:hypothetical protein